MPPKRTQRSAGGPAKPDPYFASKESIQACLTPRFFTPPGVSFDNQHHRLQYPFLR